MAKALLIKSYTTKDGTQGQWNELDDAPSYIQGIETGSILDGINAQNLSALISGVPTPWARAKLFKFALQTLATPDPNIDDSGLTQFYELLHAEWKGLFAAIALFPDRIHFSSPVTMDVRGGDYDIASAFGRMLFDDKDIWSNQDKLSKNPDEQPYIQLIYYRNHLVGGTSPMTGIFTGVDYSDLGDDASDISWYRNGKFEDPTNYLSPGQLQKVFLFVKNMNANLAEFETKVNSLRGKKPTMKLTGFKEMSRKWESVIRKKGGDNLREVGPVAQYGNLCCPFSTLFKSDVPVYLKPDFTFTYTNDGDYQLIGDIQKLLSEDKFVIGWAEDAKQRPKLTDAPVFYLQVKDIQDNSMYYFSLPLSEKGIDIFKKSLPGLLGYSQGGNTKLTGIINDAGQLAVSLVVEIDGQEVALNTREYEIDWMTDQGRVILWPNYVSEKWNKYYLYSELTSDAQQQFVPIFMWKNNILRDIEGHFLTSRYVPEVGEQKQVDVKKLITYPAGQGDDLPKYNIITTDKPMMGLSATVKEEGKDVHAGFLIFKPSVIEDRTTIDMRTEALVGVDFGSNNTCVYYCEDAKTPEPIQFGNYRSVLVGRENEDVRAVAENNELLFFTNYSSNNGQMKSWLHEHDSRYVNFAFDDEISGGVPVNRPNVVVKKMDKYHITTQAGVLHYNMKWLDDDKGIQKKRAFLKTIWLQTCAFLYTNRIRPTEISWSYPGSMMSADVDSVERIFEDLCKITPITGRRPELIAKPTTEAEAVCSFALAQDFGLNKDNMFLGIDVGGSTSDILLLAKDPANNNEASLYRESSVRLAAGVFFNAVINSDSFRQALVSFHEAHNTNVHVENIQEVLTEREKAPYYLNCIFDQLKDKTDYEEFYSSIASNAKFVFTIPAYVTGLLLFYSGMLIGKTVKTQHLDHIKRIEILSFGKGGRLFHWLRNAVSKRVISQYYADCINAGVEIILPNASFDVFYREEIENDNKAEVAKGLCDPQKLGKIAQLEDSDICGETGVSFTMQDGSPREIMPDEELTGDYFDHEMNNFDFSRVENFSQFVNIFIDFVSQKTRLYTNAEVLRNDLADLPNRVASFMKNDTEYKKARNNNDGKGFHYHQPIIIAEGSCFLESLIKKIFNQ